MNKKILYQLLSLVLIINLSAFAINDPRLTRDVVIDIDTTLTTCCAQIDVDFEGTFSVIAKIASLLQAQGCSPQFIGQADVGTTGYVITTSGVYKLSEDIIFNPAVSAAAVTINADNVLLDLQCFSIAQGNATAAVDGIAIGANHTNIMITSGRINNFSRDGIRVASGSSNLAYEDITIQNCLYGIFCLGTGVAPIEIIRAVGLDLISNSTGVSLTFVNRAFISESAWFNHAYAGVELISSFSNSITNCSIEKTGSVTGSAVGISMVQGGDNRIEQCSIDGVSTNDTFSGNSAVGIVLGATENDDLILNNQISNCTTTSNAQPFGIEMQYTFTALTNSGQPFVSGIQINGVDWSSSGRYLATGLSTVGPLTIFEYSDSTLKQITTFANVGNPAWFPNSSFLATGRITAAPVLLTIVDFSDQAGIVSSASITIGTGGPDVSPNGKFIANGGGLGNAVLVFAFSDNTIRLLNSVTLPVAAAISNIRWSPDGNYLAVAIGTSIVIVSLQGATLSVVTTVALPGGAGNANCVDWSPNGQYLAFGSSSGQLNVSLFTGSSLVPVVPVFNHGASIGIIRWSPDGEYIALAANDDPVNNINSRVLKFNKTSLTDVADFSLGVGIDATTIRWLPGGNVLALAGQTAPGFVGILTGLQFPSGSFISNNEISNIRGPALPIGQPGISSGRGLSASSGNNLIIANSAFDNDLNYTFVTNVFQKYISNVDDRVPSVLSNISFPPL